MIASKFASRPLIKIIMNLKPFRLCSTHADDDLKSKILSLALAVHEKYGWTQQAIVESVTELKLNPVAHTIVERGPVEIVEHFLTLKNEYVLTKLREYKESPTSPMEIDEKKQQKQLLNVAMNSHIDYFQPYRSTWPQALALLSSPSQLPYTLNIVQTTLDDLCQEIGFETTRYDWYSTRASLVTMMGMMEFYMIQDTSPNSQDTRNFVKNEIEIYDQMKENISNSNILHSAISQRVQDAMSLLITQFKR